MKHICSLDFEFVFLSFHPYVLTYSIVMTVYREYFLNHLSWRNSNVHYCTFYSGGKTFNDLVNKNITTRTITHLFFYFISTCNSCNIQSLWAMITCIYYSFKKKFLSASFSLPFIDIICFCTSYGLCLH